MPVDYDPRFLAGVMLFNQGDFFEAHEVWEDLWHETVGPDRRFIQGMIQVAVGLLHYANGNMRGALRLYHSSRDYLQPYHPRHLGVDVDQLCQRQEEAYSPLLATPEPKPRVELLVEHLPVIDLVPPPQAWPDPMLYLPAEEEPGS